jgi:D-amino-acid dehydrogenase
MWSNYPIFVTSGQRIAVDHGGHMQTNAHMRHLSAHLNAKGRSMGKSILVIGAGITGVSSAEWLRRDGWDVTLVDRIEPGSRDQTSYGNAGLIARTAIIPVATPGLMMQAPGMVLNPSSPLFLRWGYLPKLLPWLVPFFKNSTEQRVTEIAGALAQLTTDSVDQHQILAAGTPAAEFIRTGDYVSLYPDRAAYEASPLTIELRRVHGFHSTYLDRAGILERDPNIGPRYTFGTVFGDYAWLSAPDRYVAALFDHFRAQGGTFVAGEVADITPGDIPSVTLQGGARLKADKVVLSAGAWSGPLAKKLGLRMPVEAERGYHVSMYAPSFTAPNPYMISDAKFVLTPMDGFLRAAGVAEFAGLDAPMSQAPLDLLRRQMKQVYPALTFERDDVWMGRRPTTPDSLPVLGEARNVPNIIHAYGGQHIGMTIGPRMGRMVTDLASGRQINIDLSGYAVDRF